MNKLVELVKLKVGAGYCWGTQGEVLTPDLLKQLIQNFGEDHYCLPNGVRADKWMGKQVFDCSGLIVWASQKLGVMSTKEDATAATLFNSFCTPIGRQEVKAGDLVFYRNTHDGEIAHVGVMECSYRTIEAKSTKEGVVYGDISDFNMYGRLKVNLNTHRPIVQRLIDTGLIQSPEYWDTHLVTGGSIKAEYAMIVIEKLLDKI